VGEGSGAAWWRRPVGSDPELVGAGGVAAACARQGRGWLPGGPSLQCRVVGQNEFEPDLNL
jgi:hypothetical protein